MSQLKHLLGINIEGSHHINKIMMSAIEKAGEINWIAFAIGIVGILIIIGVKKNQQVATEPTFFSHLWNSNCEYI